MKTLGDKVAVAEWREGDGVDPRIEKKREKRFSAQKSDYSALRLASQIRNILDLLIPQSGHPLLASIVVGTVEPYAKGSNFVVQVYSTDTAADYDPNEIKAALDGLKSRLRTEVAKDITRKKAPELKFDVLPPHVLPK